VPQRPLPARRALRNLIQLLKMQKTLNQSGNCSVWMISQTLLELAVHQVKGDHRRNEEILAGNI
jgi:hypothetical protein